VDPRLILGAHNQAGPVSAHPEEQDLILRPWSAKDHLARARQVIDRAEKKAARKRDQK
jgi:hypothetical protein